MMNWAQAQITWLSATEGGRKFPPTGHKYISIAQFGDDIPAWSLIIESHEPLNKAQSIIANVRFLADDKEAPLHLLLPKSRFKLREGPKIVAIGSIVCDAEEQEKNNAAQTQLAKVLIKS